jgi:hypothetical protein
MRCEAGLQRLQPPTSAADPVRESRAIDIDPVPGEDLALPVKRKVIAVVRTENLNPGVVMMKSAEYRVRTDDSSALNRARDRRIFIQ